MKSIAGRETEEEWCHVTFDFWEYLMTPFGINQIANDERFQKWQEIRFYKNSDDCLNKLSQLNFTTRNLIWRNALSKQYATFGCVYYIPWEIVYTVIHLSQRVKSGDNQQRHIKKKKKLHLFNTFVSIKTLKKWF